MLRVNQIFTHFAAVCWNSVLPMAVNTVEIRKPFIVIVIVIKAMPSNHMPEQDVVRAYLIIQITHHVHSVTFREYLLNCVK